MSASYCRGCNASNISTREETRTYTDHREITTFYYCRDCGKVLERNTKRENINYPKDLQKDKSW